MSAGQPRLGKLGWLRSAPHGEDLEKLAGKKRRKRLGRDVSQRLQSRGLPPRDCRGARQVHAKTGDHPVARSLEQDPGQFGVAKHQIVGPFE